MLRRPPRSTLFPTRRSSDLVDAVDRGGVQRIARDQMDRVDAVGQGDPPVSAGQPGPAQGVEAVVRSEEHTSELQSQFHLVCRLLLEKKKKNKKKHIVAV